MVFVLSNLPDDVEENDVKELFQPFSKAIDVFFFKKDKTFCHSEYECTVTLDNTSHIFGFHIQNKMHNYCWKGRCIHSHMLIF